MGPLLVAERVVCHRQGPHPFVVADSRNLVVIAQTFYQLQRLVFVWLEVTLADVDEQPSQHRSAHQLDLDAAAARQCLQPRSIDAGDGGLAVRSELDQGAACHARHWRRRHGHRRRDGGSGLRRRGGQDSGGYAHHEKSHAAPLLRSVLKPERQPCILRSPSIGGCHL